MNAASRHETRQALRRLMAARVWRERLAARQRAIIAEAPQGAVDETPAAEDENFAVEAY